jgi:hypothetical protein
VGPRCSQARFAVVDEFTEFEVDAGAFRVAEAALAVVVAQRQKLALRQVLEGKETDRDRDRDRETERQRG